MSRSSPRPWFRDGLADRLHRLSFRTRLTTAFVVLIISSATATIFIGHTVFGRSVQELATSKVGFYLEAAEQMFRVRLERLRMAASAAHQGLAGGASGKQVVHDLLEEIHVDFVVLRYDDGEKLLRLPRRMIGETMLPAGRTAGVAGPVLNRLALAARQQGRAVSGLAVLGRDQAVLLGYADPPDRGMFVLAAAPAQGGRALVLGALLNGSADVLGSPAAFLPLVDASIFLDDVRIASILGDGVLGTRADPRVAERVLEQGQPYVGPARVVGRQYYAAYAPLKNLDGDIIGMLGIGTDAGAYRDVQSRTTSLFSGLIAAGMLFGFVMSYLFSRWLMRPVARLAEGMHRVAGGDLDHKLHPVSPDDLGKVVHAFNLMVKAVKQRDIKLREITEARLSQVEKQVSIGRVAAGVAHEINNPLTAVLSLSSLMLRHLPDGDPRREDLEIVITETTRCREIVRSLLDYARELPSEERIVDINEVLRTTLALTSKLEGMERVATEVALAPHLLEVSGDPKQLQQVFTNVVINAAEAACEGGTVTVRSDEDSSGGFVLVEIADNGGGIPAEYRDRVFEPFFTTKGVGKGTGLGLSVSLGIVRKHRGEIVIDSEEGRGTRVSITFPRAEEPAVKPVPDS